MSERESFRQPLLSEEHMRHVRRFLGLYVSAEEHAAMQGWVAYKRWYHKEFMSRK